MHESLNFFGTDCPTSVGTGVRDYIHVMDLSKVHFKALDTLASNQGFFKCFLGTGWSYSMLKVVTAFEHASGRVVPYNMVDRRPDDVV